MGSSATDLGFGGHESQEQGADTPLWLATAPELEGVTGQYFAHRRKEHCRFAADKTTVTWLVEPLAQYG